MGTDIPDFIRTFQGFAYITSARAEQLAADWESGSLRRRSEALEALEDDAFVNDECDNVRRADATYAVCEIGHVILRAQAGSAAA